MIGSFNFGNIRTNPANAWQGKTTAPGAAFESFDTAENGVRAVAKLLRNYGVQGVDTLEGIVSRYSPPNENRTPSLIQAAAERTGYLPAQRLDLSDPAVLDTVTRAIIQQEVGNAGPGGDVVQRGVKAALPVPTRDVAMLPTPQPAIGQASLVREENSRMATTPNRGLLDVEPEKNYFDGMGGLLGKGQTPSQPPGPTLAQQPFNVSSRMDELMQQLLQPQTRGPSMTPGQYQLAGAGSAVGQLAGVHDRKVGLGEILGALGGGLTRGTAAAEQAQQERLGSEFDRLGKFSTLQNQQRTADLNEANSVYDNQYKQALTRKALAPDVDPKVVGKGVYVNGRWEAAPWANASDGTGPLEGTGYDAQMTNIYVTLEQKRAGGQALTQQEQLLYETSKRHLMKPRVVAGPDGVVREVAPDPLPTLGGSGTAPPAPAGGPAPTPPPMPSRVTDIVPPNVKPTNEQNLNAGFANRLNTASSVFDRLETKGWKGPGFLERNLGDVPGVGNYAMSDEYQQYDQAKREFINAQLRRESGASIMPDEFESANRQYFPQPGDSEPVLAQKRRSRNLAVANMAQSAGPAKLGFTPRKVDEPGGEDPLGIR